MFQHLVSTRALVVGALLVWSLPALAVRPKAERLLAADIKQQWEIECLRERLNSRQP